MSGFADRRISLRVKNDEHKDLNKVLCQSGYEDLKKYCHKNNDFLRDVTVLFLERAKLEQNFADGLNKFAAKARKICGDAVIGSMKTSWDEFTTQTESESSIHKSLSTEIIEDIIKPLKIFADTQKDTRKTVELAVDKSSKSLAEKRLKEVQAKKSAFNKSKESENLTLQLEAARGKTMSDKDLSKLDAKCKKAEESVIKADNIYITRMLAAERARLQLDSSINSAANVFEKLEEERIEYFQKIMHTCTSQLSESIPKLGQCYGAIANSVREVNTNDDIQLLIRTRGTKRLAAEQIIFSCYEEDTTNAMDQSRRKLALQSKIDILRKSLAAEKNARNGLLRLNSVYTDTPSFSNESAQQDVSFQLEHANSVIDLLEASIHRLSVAMAKLLHGNTPSHRLSNYITESKDKQGIYTCTLCIPLDQLHNRPTVEDATTEYIDNNIRAMSYDYDDDEFDDVDPEFEEAVDSSAYGVSSNSNDWCEAAFEYVAAETDELTIHPGDRIRVVLRHDDGWWKGELRGKIGLFPATYIKE